MEPATRRRRAASTIVGTNTVRELKRRYSGGSILAAGANRGQAPDRAVAYGSALRERSFCTGLAAGTGNISSRVLGGVSGARRNSDSASMVARCGVRSNSALNSGCDGLSPRSEEHTSELQSLTNI